MYVSTLKILMSPYVDVDVVLCSMLCPMRDSIYRRAKGKSFPLKRKGILWSFSSFSLSKEAWDRRKEGIVIGRTRISWFPKFGLHYITSSLRPPFTAIASGREKESFAKGTSCNVMFSHMDIEWKMEMKWEPYAMPNAICHILQLHLHIKVMLQAEYVWESRIFVISF
jgi:hypothetical protein